MLFTQLLGHKMKLTLSATCKQVQPLIMNFPDELLKRRGDPFHHHPRKVVFVMGPTGAGKSRLAIDLATQHRGEVINSDKIQVYKGLDILTNKVTEEECQGVPHHLLGFLDPNSDFTCLDFRHHASATIKSIGARNRVPIIAGGSNSFIDALVNKDPEFRLRHDFCFLWVDVALPVLNSYLSQRVDRMVDAGLVDEARNFYEPGADNSNGVRRAIGVAEMDGFFELEAGKIGGDRAKERALGESIAMIKENTFILALRQLEKIHRLNRMWNWSIHRIDATEVFLKQGKEADEAWRRLVEGPSSMIVDRFLHENHHLVINPGDRFLHENHHLVINPGPHVTTSIMSAPLSLAAVTP